MSLAIVIILLSCVVQSHAKDSPDVSVGKFVDNLLGRVLQTSPGDHADLDNTMFGKPGNLATPCRMSLRSLHRFGPHLHATPGDLTWLWSSHKSKFVPWARKADLRAAGRSEGSGTTDAKVVRFGDQWGDAVKKSRLDEYRSLMAILYGCAGVAHLLDLLVGDSALLRLESGGVASFATLPPEGKALTLLWGAMGPAVWFARPRKDGSVKPAITDLALLAYGVVEICSAWAAGNAYHPASDPVIGALGVQVVVGGCYAILRFTAADQTQQPP